MERNLFFAALRSTRESAFVSRLINLLISAPRKAERYVNSTSRMVDLLCGSPAHVLGGVDGNTSTGIGENPRRRRSLVTGSSSGGFGNISKESHLKRYPKGCVCLSNGLVVANIDAITGLFNFLTSTKAG